MNDKNLRIITVAALASLPVFGAPENPIKKAWEDATETQRKDSGFVKDEFTMLAFGKYAGVAVLAGGLGAFLFSFTTRY